ncbi:MAG: hypothetical protein Tsb0020_13250 [Haliangiales bacterium]
MYDLDPDAREILGEHVLDFRFILDDLSIEDDEELRARTIAGAVKLTRQVLKRTDWSLPRLRQWLWGWREVLQEVEQSAGGVESLSQIARYVRQYSDAALNSDRHLVEFRRLLVECTGDVVTEAFMTAAQQLVERGREQGFEQGRAEALRATLTELIEWRFEEVPAQVMEQIERAELGDLERWTKQFTKSETLEQIFA